MKRRLPLALTAAFALAAAPAPALAAGSVEGIPHFDHVFTIVLENENLAATWHTPGTYLNTLLGQGTFASQYYATSHVSADNYMALTSAQTPTPAFNADCPEWDPCVTSERARPDGGVSVADQLDAAGRSWKAYMDGMGSPCKHPAPATGFPSADPYQSGYATRHDPFVYYPPIVDRAGYCTAHVVDHSALAHDLAKNRTTPAYGFITPDTCHDGHDAPCTGVDVGQPGWQAGGLTSTNLWMSQEVPMILGSPAFHTPGVRSLLLITTDEAANTDLTGCTTGPPAHGGTPGTCASGVPGAGVNGGGLVGALAIGSAGSGVVAGATSAVPYDHASMLRTVEDALGLAALPAGRTGFQDSMGHLNNAGSPLEHAMSGLFTTS